LREPSPADESGAGAVGEVASPGRPPAPQISADAFAPASPHVGTDQLAPTIPGKVRLVVLGDYGWAGVHEQQTAELVRSLHPDYVLTTGDNNYPLGEASTIDTNIGQYFSDFIYPYRGSYTSTATKNRFFPALGNHDWYTSSAAAYLEYFTLPGNERYYDVVLGDVHVFALDSDPNEPDGVEPTSTQAFWLKETLQKSTSAFNIVTMHHPPYSSGPHGNTPYMQWPYAEWGVDLVLAGHDHCYERLYRDGATYIVTGLGGASLYSFGTVVEGSVARYNDQYGALVLDVDPTEIRSSFFDIDGSLIDTASYRSRR
jgi:hypothetical protein